MNQWINEWISGRAVCRAALSFARVCLRYLNTTGWAMGLCCVGPCFNLHNIHSAICHIFKDFLYPRVPQRSSASASLSGLSTASPARSSACREARDELAERSGAPCWHSLWQQSRRQEEEQLADPQSANRQRQEEEELGWSTKCQQNPHHAVCLCQVSYTLKGPFNLDLFHLLQGECLQVVSGGAGAKSQWGEADTKKNLFYSVVLPSTMIEYRKKKQMNYGKTKY